jgi:hypothetical protein
MLAASVKLLGVGNLHPAVLQAEEAAGGVDAGCRDASRSADKMSWAIEEKGKRLAVATFFVC